MPKSKKLKPNKTSFDRKISFTSHIVAYGRTTTDIPFSGKIFEILEKLNGPFNPVEKARADENKTLMTYFESRYRMTDIILRQSGLTEVLEIGPGMSPRGLLWARDFTEGCYVELDLEAESMLKLRVLKELTGSNAGWPRNLFFAAGDAKDRKDFESALELFDDKPVAFICEGLLRYMNEPGKTKLALNIKRHMATHGGIWITPDIHLLSEVNKSPEMRKHYDQTAKDWKMDIRPNLFKDLAHAYSFFRSFGFKVTAHSHRSLVHALVSPGRLGLDKDVVCDYLKKRTTFVMSL